MRTQIAHFVGTTVLLLGLNGVGAQDAVTLSLRGNGTLTWTGAVLNSTCRIEWASSLDGPWHSTWPSLTNLLVTNSVMQVEVPMFYRLVCVPPPPAIADITAAEALTLLEERAGEEGFGILDVRTPTEYAAGHVIGALNLDRWSPTFAADLDALPKDHTWLVYCASGNRSAQAVAIMRDQEFRTVYNLLGGFGTFQAFPGASVWIEP
ncbi:MAG: rhodanese-like domain-containing protein [Verrucomicrobia bacterium]|nr:rhodanese-like domain-containing protein [Verrucomicrobiota bacterium]